MCIFIYTLTYKYILHTFTLIFISTLYLLNTEFISTPLIPTQQLRVQSHFIPLNIYNSLLEQLKPTGSLCSQYIYLFPQDIYFIYVLICLISLYIWNLTTLPDCRILATTRLPFHYIHVCLLFGKEERRKRKRKEGRERDFTNVILKFFERITKHSYSEIIYHSRTMLQSQSKVKIKYSQNHPWKSLKMVSSWRPIYHLSISPAQPFPPQCRNIAVLLWLSTRISSLAWL